MNEPSLAELPGLLERFRRGGELLATATTGCAGPELDFQAGPGRWSVRQIVCHLTDCEHVLVMRFRQVISEDNPTLQKWDGEKWAECLDYRRRKLSGAVEQFRRTRQENFELLSETAPESFSRAGTHTQHGRMTLLDLLRSYADHTENHIVQLKNARQAYKESRNK
jgi:hypothetical protein